MRICFVLNYFLPWQTAGTEVYTWALSKALQQLGHEVAVVIPDYESVVNSHYIHDGITVYRYAEPSKVDRSLIMGFRQPDGLPNFTKILNELQPTIVHFHELAGSKGIGLAHIAAAKALSLKIVFTFHLAGYTCKTDTLQYKGKTPCDGLISMHKCSSCYLNTQAHPKIQTSLHFLGKMAYQLGINTTRWQNKIGTALGNHFIIDKIRNDFHVLAEQADALVAITHWYHQILKANEAPIQKLHLIKQGLPSETKLPKKSTNIKNSRPLQIVFVGRWSAFKGLHILLEAIKQINPQQIGLSIFGQPDGTGYAEYWQQQTKNLPNIIWRGKLSQEEVVNTLSEFDALCLCSTFSEMSPLVIQEAFAAGIPVIATNVYGNAEQIKHGVNGFLFPMNDVPTLKIILEKCIQNKELLVNMRQNIQAPSSFDAIAKEYGNIYQQIIA